MESDWTKPNRSPETGDVSSFAGSPKIHNSQLRDPYYCTYIIHTALRYTYHVFCSVMTVEQPDIPLNEPMATKRKRSSTDEGTKATKAART